MKRDKIADGMMFKMEDDPRIIKGIGHFIRDYSIDELPQLWNVLKGEMSLIGTRPPTLDEYEKYNYHHKIRLAIKPGITGMWQVSAEATSPTLNRWWSWMQAILPTGVWVWILRFF